MLETITIEPKKTADSCIIWLHGLGADGHDFENIVPDLGLPENHRIRFIFPHAPYRSITINQSMEMRGWYDIYALDSLQQEDDAGIQASCDALTELIRHQGLSNDRIVLAGFSQGGAIALLQGLVASDPFAGIIGLSTYLPYIRNLKRRPPVQHETLPILLCHGNYDDVIPIRIGIETRDYIAASNQRTEWKAYAMGHQVCSDEIHYIGQWLTRCLLT